MKKEKTFVELRYTDFELKRMSMEEANKRLTPNGWNMRRWCELRNIGANLYSCYSGQIKEVGPGGWWY
jgi:hypothetical protein